jgi:hypothetical protein
MTTEKQRPTLWRLLLVVAALAAVGGGAALADYMVGAGEPVVISDDVFDRTTDVISMAGPNASDNNRSGLADETNPGVGDGTGNSPNNGTDNPNQSPNN